MAFLSKADENAIRIAFCIWNDVDKHLVQRAIDQINNAWGKTKRA